MNVEIGTEAEQFPVKEYLNGILVAVAATPWLTGGGVAWLLSLYLSLGYNYVIPIIRAWRIVGLGSLVRSNGGPNGNKWTARLYTLCV
jgi:hypothetical protein